VRILQAGGDAGQGADGGIEGLLFAAQLLRPLLVAPDTGVGEELFYE
jgi:hypothetical protein